MSEWIRHRGSKSMPKCLEGKRFEVRYRDGTSFEFNNIALRQASDMWTHNGVNGDIMAYRIVSELSAAPAITPPDHYKGFPVGTTAKDIGAKVGDEFVVVDSEHYHFEKGETVTLAEDDGTNCPFFIGEGSEKLISIRWFRLAPISPKTAIELQAEEVGIPEPVQEWPEDRVNVIGHNGNDGLHYEAESKPTSELIADLKEHADKALTAFEVGIVPANKYQRTIKGVTVDVYDVLAAFNVTCQARGHAIKKLLMAGRRGRKDEAQDLREAVQAIDRSIELISK